MEITGHTKLTGLIGTPVSHSISPQMHNEAFRMLGLDYVYLAFDVKEHNLSQAVYGLKAIGVQGLNITMPYKARMIEYMDDLTPAARIAKACNTVIVKGTRFIGHTTDGVGFMRAVEDAGYDITGKKMTILGFGGAAAAICTQAALDGVTAIDIFQHFTSPKHKIAVDIADTIVSSTGCVVSVYDFGDNAQLKKSLEESCILVNATSVGMAPSTDQSPITNPKLLYPGLIVCDIIYNPKKTRLYRMAEEAGCHVFNGMYMLLFQGAASFECWTGQKMPVEAIRGKYFSQ